MSQALLVSEIFPPAVGGSGELFNNVYGRFGDVPVRVLTEPVPPASDWIDPPSPAVIRENIKAPYWGLSRPGGLVHHVDLARRIRQLSAAPHSVVHCARALPEGVAAWMARRLFGAPYVCWAHGEDVATAQLSRELNLVMRRVFRGAHAAIANSRSTATMLTDIGVPTERIAVVYPGVDSSRFLPDIPGAAAIRSRYAQPGEVLALTVGRLQRRKGHDLVLRALSGLPASARIRYLIVGDGEERARLEGMMAELRLQDRVHFLGLVPSEDLPAYYAASDFFVHPNRLDGRDVEGFGIVFLEAASAGKAAIGGASGGVPEAVLKDQTGLLVSGLDVEELRHAMLVLASSIERRTIMGQKARRRVDSEFSWEAAAAKMRAIHDRVSRGERLERA